MSKFEIYKKDNSYNSEQCWRWRLVDSNGAKIAKSEEPFIKSSIEGSIKTIKDRVDTNTPVFLDESNEDTDKGYRFEYFKSEKNNEWYWKLRAGNNETMASGGEGFTTEQSIKVSIVNVKVEIGRADIVYE